MKHIVIVGAGMAGCMLAEALSNKAHVTIVEAGKFRQYSKPRLSVALTQKVQPQDLVVSESQQFAQQWNVTVQEYFSVEKIDTEKQTLTSAAGQVLQYDQLVLATGSRPKVWPQAKGGQRIHAINSLSAYESLLEDLKGKQHVGIVGSGLVGLELANTLLAAGWNVTMVSQTDHAMSKTLPPAFGVRIREALQQAGLEWLTAQVSSFREGAGRQQIAETDQGLVAADVWIAAIGIEANTPWKPATGQHAHGYITNAYGQVEGYERVYALGDCASWQGLMLHYVPPIRHTIKAMVSTLLGQPQKIVFPAMPVTLKLPVLPTAWVYPQGHDQVSWRRVQESISGWCDHAYNQAGQLVGFALQGDQVAKAQELAAQCCPPIGKAV